MKFTLPYRMSLITGFSPKSSYWHTILLILTVFFSQALLAHDIPSSLTLHAYVKPEGKQLNLLVRVPMEALSEIDFPTRGPGYLDFEKMPGLLEDIARTYIRESVKLYENEQELNQVTLKIARVSLPTNKSFVSYAAALENFARPTLNNSDDLYWSQGMMDIWLTYAIQAEDSAFSIQSSLDRLGLQTTTVLRFVLPDGGERLFNYLGNPGVVELDPSFGQAIWRFVVLGFDHILDGLDHLLFLLCLVIPLRNVRALIPVITAFTVAHSITLISSAFGIVPNVLWFGPMIEMLIALSIVYMAFENIVFASKDEAKNLPNRWLVTFGFGLIHGFGFSFVLSETMQFAGGHLFTSLLAFNVGVEFGQLLVLLIVVPVLALLFKSVLKEKVGVMLLSALVAHTAWHWMMERGGVLLQYEMQWPVMDLVFWIGLMRWLMLSLVVAGAVWLMFGFAKKFQSVQSAK